MGDKRPFHVQLHQQLRRRFWTPNELCEAICSHQANGISSHAFAGILNRVLDGRLAPTTSLGELIAEILFGTLETLDRAEQRAREDLIGAAFVAERHGARQQPPYVHGVFGRSEPDNRASTVDDTETRRLRVERARVERLFSRMRELEEQQRDRKRRRLANRTPQKTAHERTRKLTSPKRTSETREAIPVEGTKWDEALEASLAFIPSDDGGKASRDKSFLYIVRRSYAAGHKFPQFLQSLLVAWRPEKPSRRARLRERMSPEQLGSHIAQRNRERYRADDRRQAWFQCNKGPGISGTGLRNYLQGEHPLRESLLKMIWALSDPGDIQLRVEQMLWKTARRGHLIHPATLATLIEIVEGGCDSRHAKKRIVDAYPHAVDAIEDARAISANIADRANIRVFKSLATSTGMLLMPLVDPESQQVVVDVAKISPENGELLTSVDVALSTGKRSALMRALVDSSGMPLARIAELTAINPSMFQQWMRDSLEQRIENLDRARTILNLLNPPPLKRWPITAHRIIEQNERALTLLTRNAASLDEALRAAQECPIPAEYGLDQEGEKTYRAATLLRMAFGRGSLTNLSGPEVGRKLETASLGNEHAFNHLRDGVRDAGRKSARRATLEQAEFLADLLDEQFGELTQAHRKEFIGCVACVDLDELEYRITPVEMLTRAADADSPFTIQDMMSEMAQRTGGIARFSRESAVSATVIRRFISRKGHYLQHRVASRVAERCLGFHSQSEEHRVFVVLSVAAWQQPKKVRVRLSDIFMDYSEELSSATKLEQVRQIRADTMRTIVSQAAMSPRELAGKLGVTETTFASWTTPRVGHFTAANAVERFIRLMSYEAEQADFIRESFGPTVTALVVARVQSKSRTVKIRRRGGLSDN